MARKKVVTMVNHMVCVFYHNYDHRRTENQKRPQYPQCCLLGSEIVDVSPSFLCFPILSTFSLINKDHL